MGERSRRRRKAKREATSEPDQTSAADESQGESLQTVVDEGVIDLRSTYADAAEGVATTDGDAASEQWDHDQEGWQLKLAMSATEQVEVRLPAGFGSPGSPTPGPGIDLGGQNRGTGVDAARPGPGSVDDREVLAALSADAAVAELRDLDTDRPTTWRELGDLLGDDARVFGQVTDHLAVHALEPSGWPSTQARPRAHDPADVAPAANMSRKTSIAELLVTHLRGQFVELTTNESGVRVDEVGSVHRMRVATRRMRSALATYRPWLVGPRWAQVSWELRRLGEDLGRARDAEVLHLRLNEEIEALPEELVVGPVEARVDSQLRARHTAALDAVLASLDGARYLDLLEELDELLADPPLTAQARQRARTVLPDRVGHDGDRVRRAYASFDRARDTPRADALLHDVRKAAKRARYAAESAEPVLGKPAGRLAGRMERVQQVLGESQDSAAARALIRHLVFQAHMAGENCFTFGLLYGREMTLASEARAAATATIESALVAVDQLERR
jgi:CHAD domain-containing protein